MSFDHILISETITVPVDGIAEHGNVIWRGEFILAVPNWREFGFGKETDEYIARAQADELRSELSEIINLFSFDFDSSVVGDILFTSDAPELGGDFRHVRTF